MHEICKHYFLNVRKSIYFSFFGERIFYFLADLHFFKFLPNPPPLFALTQHSKNKNLTSTRILFSPVCYFPVLKNLHSLPHPFHFPSASLPKIKLYPVHLPAPFIIFFFSFKEMISYLCI